MMCSAWIFAVLLGFFTKAFGACSANTNSGDCESGDCVWLPGKCETLQASDCDNSEYTRTGECPGWCELAPGTSWSCVNSKVEVCAAAKDNEAQCSTIGGCQMEPGACSRSGAEPVCDTSAELVVDGSYYGRYLKKCPTGCAADSNDVNTVLSCEVSLGSRNCASFPIEKTHSECTLKGESCAVSQGSCVVDSLKWKVICASYSVGAPESACSRDPECRVMVNETTPGFSDTCTGKTEYGSTYCHMISTVQESCGVGSGKDCEVVNGHCVPTATALVQWNTTCNMLSTVLTSSCERGDGAGQLCEISPSGTECIDLTAEEVCIRRALRDCTHPNFGIIQCQVNDTGFCVPYTPTCTVNAQGNGCLNPESDQCVLVKKIPCHPIDCSASERWGNHTQCTLIYPDIDTGCTWTASSKTCRASDNCWSYECDSSPACVLAPQTVGGGECKSVASDGLCEQHLHEVECGKGCRWNEDSGGRCVEKTCPTDPSYSKCCTAGDTNCGYCKDAVYTTYRPPDCPAAAPPNCETAPSNVHCCPGDGCTAFCDNHPSLCANTPDCMTNPSYSLCCPGHSCNAYCTLHPEDCVVEPEAEPEVDPEVDPEVEPPTPVACDQRTPTGGNSNKCGEKCYYTADLAKCSTSCGQFYSALDDFTCKPKSCEDREPDAKLSSNKCGVGCSYSEWEGEEEGEGIEKKWCSTICANRKPENGQCGSKDCFFVSADTCSPNKEDVPPQAPPGLADLGNSLAGLLADPSTEISSGTVTLPEQKVSLPPLSLGGGGDGGGGGGGGSPSQPVTLAVVGSGAAKTTLDVEGTSYKTLDPPASGGGDWPTEVCLNIVESASGYLSDMTLSFTSSASHAGRKAQRKNAGSLAFTVMDSSGSFTVSNAVVKGTLPSYFIHFVSGTVLLYKVTFSQISLTQYFITLPTGSASSSSFTLSSSSLKDLSLPIGSTHALFHEAAATNGSNDVTFNKVTVDNVTVAGQTAAAAAAGWRGLRNAGETQTAVIYHSRNAAGSNRQVVVKSSDFTHIKGSNPYYAPFVISGTVSAGFKATFSQTSFGSNVGFYAGALYVDANTTVEISSSTFYLNEYSYQHTGYGSDISTVGESAKVVFSTGEGLAAPCTSSGLPAITQNKKAMTEADVGICPGRSRASAGAHTPEPANNPPPPADNKLPTGAIVGIVIGVVVVVVAIAGVVAFVVFKVVKKKSVGETQTRAQTETGSKEPKGTEAQQEMENVE